MKNKLDEILDALYGQKIKGRWVKALSTVVIILLIIGGIIFLSTNLGYSNGKFFLKPWQIKIDVDLDLKKSMDKQQRAEVEQK